MYTDLVLIYLSICRDLFNVFPSLNESEVGVNQGDDETKLYFTIEEFGSSLGTFDWTSEYGIRNSLNAPGLIKLKYALEVRTAAK